MAATIYTTTINETTIRVQDVILEIMMGKNFYIDDVDANKVIVGKNFGDGIWVRDSLLQGQIQFAGERRERESDGHPDRHGRGRFETASD